MRMEATLSPRLEQRMKLAPQIIQSIEILQLPLLALQERVEQELEENPVLELEEASEDTQTDELSDPPEVDDHAEDGDDYERMQEIAEDYWHDYSSQTTVPRKKDGEADEKLEALQNTAAKSISLQDHLFNQLTLMELSERMRDACENIVYNIDSNGYLQYPLQEIVDSMDEEVTLEEVEDALAAVQAMEPPGVGARDLRECLLLQLDPARPANHLPRELVMTYLEDIEMNRYPAIVKSSGHDIEDVKRAVDLIKALNPKPGALFEQESIAYVVPDVRVEYRDSKYEVILDDNRLPQLYISTLYKQLLRTEPAESTTRAYIQKKIESARWLIDAIEQRRNTLQRLACKIVDMQQGFLEKGVSRLKPLKMQDVAEEVGVHVSTVSRAISRKYMQTPQGIVEMKFFFTGGTTPTGGTEKSWVAVKEKIKEVIDGEDKASPLSDDDIAGALQNEGYDIARRTVTKYRKAMKIPSSRQRREY